MKTYKKIDDKIYSVEQVEVEVNVMSLEARVETLNKAIDKAQADKDRLNKQIDTYQAEKDSLKADIKEIKKLK